MKYYVILYTIHDHNWERHLEVERVLAECGRARRNKLIPNFIRLDSKLGRVAIQRKLLATLDIRTRGGDSYYLVEIDTYREIRGFEKRKIIDGTYQWEKLN